MHYVQARFLIVTVLVIVFFMLVATGAASAREFQALHKFRVRGTDGCSPGATLTFDTAGNLYGTTYRGGSAGPDCSNDVSAGTVFRLTPNPDGTWTETVIFNFTGGPMGGSTYAPVIFDAQGNIYGTTLHGGSPDYGTVFKLTPQPDGSWKETVLWSFTNGSDGASPFGGLSFDSKGNLYGTTNNGAFGGGTVFRLTPNPDGTWAFSTLYIFGQYRTDGFNASSGVISDANGVLYGTTAFGGDYEVGTVFSLTPNPDGSWTEHILHSFSGPDGRYCYPGLVMDGAGNLYGMTTGGGINDYGVVFRLARQRDGSWKFKRLHAFRGVFGAEPFTGPTLDSKGNLYGSTQGGGQQGMVFKLEENPDGDWKISGVHNFKGKDGERPMGGVTFDAAGNLYGTTFYGGHGAGVVFKITP